MDIDANRCIGEFFLQSCLGNRSVGYRHPPYQPSQCCPEDEDERE